MTGDVTVNINGTEYPVDIVNGTGTIEIPLGPGNYTVNATVSNDPKYDDKTSNNETFENPKINDYEIKVDVVPGSEDKNTTITVIVPKDIDGKVTVIVDGKEYPVTPVNGTAVIELPLDSGIHNVTVKLSNDTKYCDKQNSTSFVIPENMVDLEIIVSVNSSTVEVNGLVEYIINVYNKGSFDAKDVIVNTIIPKGLVYVSDDLNDENYKGLLMAKINSPSYEPSTGLWYVGDLAAGDSSQLSILLRAETIGEKTINSAVSSADKESDLTNNNKSVIVNVNPISDYNMNVNVTPGKPGENTTITVTLPEDSDGDLVIVVDGEEYPVTPSNGTAILELPLDAGNHTVIVKLTNDSKYADKNSEVTFSINQSENKEIKSENRTADDIGETSNVVLNNNATGNPLLVLLLALFAVGFSRLRRFKK